MESGKVDVRRLSRGSEQDFWAVHSEKRGHGWCCCTAWQALDWASWSSNSAPQNRRARQAIFDRGEHDGYLLYVEGKPVGWCQAGPVGRRERLRAQFNLTRGDWAISCLYIGEQARGQGLAQPTIATVLEDLWRRGAEQVHAFPKEYPPDDPEGSWTGPRQVYERLGFRVLREQPPWTMMLLGRPA